MKTMQFSAFIVYDLLKCLYRAYRDKVPFRTYVKPHLDGLFNRVDYSIFNIPYAVWKNDKRRNEQSTDI